MKTCNSDIYKNGKSVATLRGRAGWIDILVADANKLTTHKMGWHYNLEGKATVKTLGDVNEAFNALNTLHPEWMTTMKKLIPAIKLKDLIRAF